MTDYTPAVGDYVAFPFSYIAGEKERIEVAQISGIVNDKAIVHFLYGYKSVSEVLGADDIIAVGINPLGEANLPGWRGNFTILRPEHELLQGHPK